MAFGLALGLAGQAEAAVVLVNGSFETIGASLGSGLFEATGWTNLSSLPIQASSAPSGFEATSAAGVTGSRYLRLASDNPDPSNTGFIVQNLGTMAAGETYSISGTLLGGASAVNLFSLTARFASDSGLNPATVYAEQVTAGLAAGAVVAGGLSLSYTAGAADAGQNLYIWLRVAPSGLGTAVRGGVDNLTLQVTGVPEPGTFGMLGMGGLALAVAALRRR
ncbi:MAG: PEP-CTERM sorting domain-containing protein [Bryobacterales bacterium]|nr:PEP-CTERM sorting domain-containing protein [Bryobacterales bacterium]